MTKEKQTPEKKTEQADFIGRIQKTAESFQGKVKEYNEKYVTKTIEKGKGTVKQYGEKYVTPVVEKGRTYVDGPAKKISGSMDELLSKGRSIEKDARKKIDGYVENGRKYFAKLPIVESMEKRMTSGFNRVPAIVNLPGKNDIEKLTQAMESLNANLEALKKQAMV